jgi:hypothetical protein
MLFGVMVTLGAVLACRSASPGSQRLITNVEVSAGGGFAGIREAEVQAQPNLVCGSQQPPQCTEDATSNVFTANTRYSWRPSLSTGVVFRFTRGLDTTGNVFGWGFGGNFVFVPSGKDAKPAPAITFHLGTRSTQLFIGSLFIPVDKAEMPGGTQRFVGPRNLDPQTFIRAGADRAPSFFAGIVVAGAAVTHTK